jgi:hypothetical protein
MTSFGLTALVLAVGSMACSDPRCWTSGDASNLVCTMFPKSNGGSGGRRSDPEKQRKEEERLRKDYTRRCAVGEPVPCGAIADFYERDAWAPARAQPPATIEAAYAVACLGKVRLTAVGNSPCQKSGGYAERRGVAGGAAALQRYAVGCSLDEGRSCLAAARLDPARELEFMEVACRLEHPQGCIRAAQIYSDPTSAHHDTVRARTMIVDGCKRSIDELCEMLGKLEVETR